MEELSADALRQLLDALIQTWKIMWEDQESLPARMGVMEGKLPEAFAQHARTWAFLEASGMPVPDRFKAPPQWYLDSLTPAEPAPDSPPA